MGVTIIQVAVLMSRCLSKLNRDSDEPGPNIAKIMRQTV